MKKPNISIEEFNEHFKTYRQSIAKAIANYVNQNRLSENEATEYLKTIPDTIDSKIVLLAIRGYYKDTMGKEGENDRAIFDDAIAVFAPNYYKTFNANTDPRKAGIGIASLLPGVHFFKKGFHGYGRSSGHWAFRTANQAEVLPVFRDGQTGIKDGHTINLHSGGEFSTNSAGCQTIIKSQWQEFKVDLYGLMEKYDITKLPYILIENLE